MKPGPWAGFRRFVGYLGKIDEIPLKRWPAVVEETPYGFHRNQTDLGVFVRINANESAAAQLANLRTGAADDAAGTTAPAKSAKASASGPAAPVGGVETTADAATAAVAAENARAAVSVALRTGRQVASVVARSTFDLRV